jgi:hypothetical protein
MSAARDLPARPSLDSLRKQAKKLARDAAAGEAKIAIHNRDDDRLRTLLAEHPTLVTWRDENGETLLSRTTPYALDVSDPERERIYTRPMAAEMLIDAGMAVEASTWEHLIGAGASEMLQLLARKHVLPPTLPVLAALGDGEAVRARLDASRVTTANGSEDANDRIVVGRALMNTCRFKHTATALELLERAVSLDPDLGRRIDRWQGREAFVDFLVRHPGSHWSGGPTEGRENTPWQAFVIRQLTNTLDENDLLAFGRWLDDESWVLEAPFVHVQIGLIERCCWRKPTGESFIRTLLEREPALLRVEPPPRSSALVFALDYGHAHLLPLLTRVWPFPDDLPFAAGSGNAAAAARWFDDEGRPVLGSLARHYPASDPNFKRADLGWGPPSTQQVLDVALAWACLNHRFEIALFLLERGANINSDWGTHEPASLLHEAAIQGNEDAARFLIDHGADLTMKDYRYQSNAEGWARYGSGDERMANLLATAATARSRQQ